VDTSRCCSKGKEEEDEVEEEEEEILEEIEVDEPLMRTSYIDCLNSSACD
jgi:hypothetical protein